MVIVPPDCTTIAQENNQAFAIGNEIEEDHAQVGTQPSTLILKMVLH
jgi:hypothetical protein